jgi:hypothetical protein
MGLPPPANATPPQQRSGLAGPPDSSRFATTRICPLSSVPCNLPVMAIEVGKPAPPFTLRNKLREEVTLDSFPGKHLVLAFYPLAFTGG